MSDIIPRKRTIPVQARRTEMPPETIQIPGMPPMPIPVPPPQPGVTQNIIYVNVPAGPPVQMPAPPSAPTSSEVHFHTTNIYQAPRRSGGRLGTSFPGLWGLVFGGVAAGAAYVPPLMSFVKPIAMVGGCLAAVGLLGALLLGRVGRGVPVLALLVCGSAYGLWLNNSGQLASKYEDIRSRSPVALPKIEFDGKPAAPTVTAPVSPSAKPAVVQPPQDPTRLHDHTIFGDGAGTWVKPSGDLPATPSAPVSVIPVAPAPVTSVPVIDPATATANLETARTAAAKRMGVDYTGAKSMAADAQSDYQNAQIANAPGSPELIAASQKRLQADSQLNVMEMKLRSDPVVAAAEAAVKSATPPGR